MNSILFFISCLLFSLNCYSQYDINSTDKIDDKWKLRIYLSHSFTEYYNTDIEFLSSRYNVEIKDYQWIERGSREFFLYKKWIEQGNNPLQMIDEPSNTFVLSIEKNNNEFFLSG